MKKGQEPAFPSEGKNIVIGQITYNYIDENGMDQIGQNNEFGTVLNPGMSKRFYAACCAMQGILAGHYEINLVNAGFPDPISISTQAYQFADEILKQEEE